MAVVEETCSFSEYPVEEQKKVCFLLAVKVYLKLSKLFPEGESVQVQNVHKRNIQSVYCVPKAFALKYE